MRKTPIALSIAAAMICVAAGLSNLVKPSFALTNGGSITSLGVPLTESFDTLATTGTNLAWTDNSTIPGWYSTRATYNSGTGSSNTGALYSYGVAGTNPVTDRALGSVGSAGTGTIYWGVRLTNNTGTTITSLDVTYFGEQWRNGGSTAPNVSVAQTVDFQYQIANAGAIVGINSPATGWLDHDALDFTSPTFGTTAAATLDGNAGANRIQRSATLSVTIADGQEVWLRWVDINHPDNDHGLAIDDFSVIAHGAPLGDTAPTVTSTTPVDSAGNVAVDASIIINFSESVTATASAFAIECPTGSPQTFTQSGSPSSTFTLTPSSPLPYNTICTVTVAADQITDTDLNPPDQMASNFVFSFTTTNPIDAAPTVVSTTPANSANNVAVGSTVLINFSESVDAIGNAFALECPMGVAQTFTRSATPASSVTLTPTSALPYSTACTVTVTASQITDTDTNDPPDQMASDFSFAFTTANPPPPVATNVVINEVDADTPGTDTAEFVELYDGGVGNTPLDGLAVVFFNGNGDTSYAAFDLDGRFTNASGYFILGNAATPGVDLIFADNVLQNGADAVALYAANASDFPNGTIVTTTNLQDAIVYGTDDPVDSGLLVLLNASQPQVNEDATQSSQRCPNGTGGARNTSTYFPGTPTPGAANGCPPPQPPSTSAILISQVYGGGGNSGATYQSDYVELFNRGMDTVDIGGWSLQYTSATGNSWDFGKQPLGGTIAPGEYFLIALASGANGDPLPPANITGQINMSGTSGKIALVNSFDSLAGNCPLSDPHLMDFVGYGSPDCREGATTAPAPSNTTALFRLGGGATDTNRNGNDFITDTPAPRRTAPIVELGPMVLSTDPRTNGTNAPRDATIAVTFTEPVDVVGSWFDITCASGQHNSATFASSGLSQVHYITPNGNFQAGEQCTVTIFKDQIRDQDLDDFGPNTDTLPANYVWSFTVADGTAPPYPSSVHLTMGNPSGAGSGDPNNYLMEKPEFALSYNRDLGRPNWVSWHLSDEWFGTLARVDSFRPDPAVPPEWYRVQSFDFAGSGFDRGHMTPNADRDKETSIPINQATFLMSNMVAQAPDNNQGPWAEFENYLRTVATEPETKELYIVSGGVGAGGTGSNGGVTTTLANGHVTVPAQTWKVALVLPKGDDDTTRVSCSTRTIAVIMPNVQGIRNDPWENFLTNVDAVETLTGYNLFSNLPPQIQACVEAGTNGNNPPLDTVAPSISCTPPDGAWHPGNVALACTAGDNGSGLANTADASFSLVTSVGPGIENASAATDSRTVCDVAGNCATAGPIAGNKIDRKGPAISITAPSNGAVYELNQAVSALYNCSDTGAGPGTCVGPVISGSPVTTSTLGTKTFVVDATDAVGNASSMTVTYEVRRTLTAVGPAKVWVGLKNSDDNGLRLDLRAEVLVNGAVAALGELANVSSGSSGFNNALLQSITMSLASGPVDVPAGAQLSVRVMARRTCASSGHNSGTAREWYNGQPTDSGTSRDAGSRVSMTLAGVASDYFLRNAFALALGAGASRQFLDATVNGAMACPARPYVPFGMWSATLP